MSLVDDFEQALTSWRLDAAGSGDRLAAARKALEDELAALRKDAERLDWLIANADVILDKPVWVAIRKGASIQTRQPGRREVRAVIRTALKEKTDD